MKRNADSEKFVRVGLCGIGVPPMLHGRDAHATLRSSARIKQNPYKSAVSTAWLLAVAVCACAVTVKGQEDRKAPSPKTGAEQNLWTIGIYTGPSPFELSAPAHVKNPVLTGADVTDMKDLNVDTVAHPFMVATGSRYYVFFTAKDLKADKGGIGLAESGDGFEWKFRRTVIREPFVLSHPCVFQWHNDYYLVPEAHTETSVRLYRAASFPDQWKYEGDLIKGDHFISPTLTQYQGMWWLFAAAPGNGALRLFHAPDLKGPWTEHPHSPIVKDDLRTSRPAGRPFVIDNVLYRLGMDCYPTYGSQVRAFQITDLSPGTYVEKMIETPLVKASSKGWNALAMHHVDALRTGSNQWLAVVDALGR